MTEQSDQQLLEAIVSAIEDHAEQAVRARHSGRIDTRQYRVTLSELWPQLGGIAKHYERITGNANAARINAAVMRALPHLAENDTSEPTP